MRTDKAKNIQKVTTAVIKDPLKTEREIAKETGLGNGTTHRALKDLEQSGAIDRSGTIVKIEEEDLKIVRRSQEVASRFLGQTLDEDKVNSTDASIAHRMGVESQKRYSMLAGEGTDEQGGYKDIEKRSNEELIAILNE